MNDQEFENRLRDLIIARAAYLTRYTTGQARKAVRQLNKALAGLEAELAARLVTIEQRGLDIGPTTTRRIDRQVKEIRAIIADAYTPVNKAILDDLAALAEDEGVFVTKALKTVKKSITADAKAAAGGGGRKTGTLTSVKGPRKANINLEVQYPTHSPDPTMLRAIVETKPMSGKHLKSWADKMSRDTQEAVEGAFRDGLSQAKTTDQIVRSIVGTKANKYADGILQASRKSIDALVRTAITHVHNVAAQMSYAENDDVVQGWRYLAVLDLRTTRFCAAHDGKKYELGKGPIPPNHVRCRSICQPVTLTMRELGVEVEEATPLTRASMDGPVDGKVIAQDWWMRRTVAEQDEFLGKARAKAFRAGKIKFEDLFKEDGRELTLKELRDRHPTAF